MGEADGARGPLSGARAERQARSIEAALRGRGLDEHVRQEVHRALATAMRPRVSLLDEHHPAFLHPGRAVLVLLHDVQSLPPTSLSLAALHESQDAGLAPTAEQIARVAPSGVAEALREIPRPGDESLGERLVLLERDAALAALAERLDHLRHLHLRDDHTHHWKDAHAQVGAVWLPFAQRMDERLARRLAHWYRTFEKRLRRRGQFPLV